VQVISTYYCNIVKFTFRESLYYSLDTEYVGRRFAEVTNIRFVGVKIDFVLSGRVILS
jgi:hypothetical protein